MPLRRAARAAGSSVFRFGLAAWLVTACGCSTSGAGTGGQAGAGGAAGAIGSTDASGTGGSTFDAAPTWPSCTPVTAVDPLVLDFSAFNPTSNQAMFGVFGTSFAGGTYQYPAAITSTFTGGNWHLTGPVMDYSGFGLYLSCKSNVAGFTGLQMDISGTFTSGGVGDDGGLLDAHMTIGISQPADQFDTAHATELSWGTCTANCNAPVRNIQLTPTTTTVDLPWTSFGGGTPVGPLDPTAITGIFFTFPWSGASTAQYTVDVTIDNIQFTRATAGSDAATSD